jgi:hypothetical protein
VLLHDDGEVFRAKALERSSALIFAESQLRRELRFLDR